LMGALPPRRRARINPSALAAAAPPSYSDKRISHPIFAPESS
jgi:hypothetical protein